MVFVVLPYHVWGGIRDELFIHFKDEKGQLTYFTEICFKVLTSHGLWLSLDGEQREIADKTAQVMKNLESLNNPPDKEKISGKLLANSQIRYSLIW